jgi:hypothetical protein
MPSISNLKQTLITNGKQVIGQAQGKLEEVAGAAGKGAFSVSAGPNGVSISANFNELLKKTTQGNRVVSPIKELFERDKFKKSLQYPDDLDNEHYMIFKVMRRERKSRLATEKRNVVQNIILPIPSSLSVSQQASYADENLGIAGAMAAGDLKSGDISSAATSLADMVGGAITAATDAFKTGDTDAAVSGAGMAMPIVATKAAAALGGGVGGLLALGGTSGGVISGVSKKTGLALNPHMAVIFNGVGFRTHSFSYKFIARNQDESDEIKDIINTFKYAMLPSYEAGKLAFQYPDEFDIVFAEAVQDYMYDIGRCVLTDTQVQYNGENIPLFFENVGAPVSITLSLSFKETKIHTKERLEKRINY